jgi:hypothetical protein
MSGLPKCGHGNRNRHRTNERVRSCGSRGRFRGDRTGVGRSLGEMSRLSPRGADRLVGRRADPAAGPTRYTLWKTLGDRFRFDMSIHPNRVLWRIIDQVEKSDWPALDFETQVSIDREESVRIFRGLQSQRHATPFHFWVHALRDDLAARSRLCDLVGVAGYALSQKQTPAEWEAENGFDRLDGIGMADDAEIYRMQASVCRRSSVVSSGGRLWAHFWSHGLVETWRRAGVR